MTYSDSSWIELKLPTPSLNVEETARRLITAEVKFFIGINNEHIRPPNQSIQVPNLDSI